MSPLEQALYQFLTEHRFAVSDGEYPDFCRSARGWEDRLCGALSPEQESQLSGLLLALQLKTGAELEGMFAAALRLGLELGRL